MSPVQSRVSAGPNNTSSFCRLCLSASAVLFFSFHRCVRRLAVVFFFSPVHVCTPRTLRTLAAAPTRTEQPEHPVMEARLAPSPRESPPHALRRAALPVRPVRPKVQPGQQPQAAHPHAHWREAVRVHRVLGHPGEKPYGCTECPQRFSDRSGLVNHLRRHHVGFSPCVRSLTDHRQKKVRSKEKRYQPASLAQKRGKEETLCRDQDSNLGYCGHNARY